MLSDVVRFGPGIPFHVSGPLQKTRELCAFPPHETPEFQKSYFIHFHATISFNAPAQIRTAPRRQVVTACGVPEKSQHVSHGYEVALQAV
jgi:hypothetical protein